MAETQCRAPSAQPEEAGESSKSAQAPQAESSSSSQAAETAAKTCANCLKPESDAENNPHKPCIMCKSVSYCSRDCKKAHTKQHKKVCATAAQEYSKTAEFKLAPRAAPKQDSHRGGLQKWQFDT